MRKAIVGLLLLTIQISVFSQAAWEMKYLPGFLVPHHDGMAEMMAHIQGVEIGRQWKVDSAGVIARYQSNPYAGLAVNYFQLGNKNKINGESVSFLGFYDAGLKIYKNTTLRGRFAFGLGYLTKKYDMYTNPQNRAIGSHLNGFIQMLFYVQTPLSKRLDLQLGLGLSHYSNGNWDQPNLGINLPSAVLGFRFKDNNKKYMNVLQNYQVPNVVQWQFSARLGRRQIGIDNPKNITNYIVEAVLIYPQNPFRLWRFGVVSFFDRTYVYTKFQPWPDKIRADQITEIAIQAGHEYRIGKFGFVTDMGLYVYRPDRTKRMYYEGIGIKYYATPNIVIMNRLKAHLSSADYFEWGICYNIVTKVKVKPGFLNEWKWTFGGWKRED